MTSTKDNQMQVQTQVQMQIIARKDTSFWRRLSSMFRSSSSSSSTSFTSDDKSTHTSPPNGSSAPGSSCLAPRTSNNNKNKHKYSPSKYRKATTPTAFPLFSSLPPEIRLKIYGYVMHFPLYTEVANARCSDVRGETGVRWPPLLAVCRESRVEAVRYYENKLGKLGQFKDFGNGEAEDPERTVKRGKWKKSRMSMVGRSVRSSFIL